MNTLASYDAIPYDSIPITDTHVESLAAIARLFGVAAPDPGQARVLELGCAEGGNLIPMAFYSPDARFVGIDLSRRQIEIGQDLIAACGLANVELLHRDLTRGAEDLGKFDYIIAHGLYSWVPPAVQHEILALCARHLAPTGIAYVSFNALPGWRMRGMLRDILLHHCRAANTPKARLALAYQFIHDHGTAFAAMPGKEASFIGEELAYLRRAPASYLYHEYLEEINEPLLFAEFMRRARAAGLDYVADAELFTMLPATLGEAGRDAVAQIDDRIAREQLMDYLRGRRFRRCLLTHRSNLLREAPDMDGFRQLGFHADLASEDEIDLGSSAPQHFYAPTGASFQVCHPLAKAAAMLLAGSYPDAMGFEALEAGARELVMQHGATPLADDGDAFALEWFSLVAWQAVRIVSTPQALGVRPSGRPRAHALARAQAAQSETLASIRHTAVSLDALGVELVQLLDGSHTLDTLAHAMTRKLNGDAAAARAGCERLLWTFMRNGLLETA